MLRASVPRRVLAAGAVAAGTLLGAAAVVPFAHAEAVPAPSYTFHNLNIGGGGFATGVVAHPSAQGVIFARTDVGGLYRWESATQRWQQILRASRIPNPTADDAQVESVAVAAGNADVVYAAVGDEVSRRDGRVLKSVDRGEHWTDTGLRLQIHGNGEFRTGGERLAVDPADPNHVLFGSREQGLWESRDGGANWHKIDAVPVGSNDNATEKVGIKTVLFDPSDTARIFAAVAGDGIYVSEDGGTSWTRRLTYASTETPADADIAASGVGYFSTPQKIYKWASGAFSDTGAPESGGCDRGLAVNSANADQVVFAGCAVRAQDGFFTSADGGATWQQHGAALKSNQGQWIINSDEIGYMSVGSFAFEPGGRLWFSQGMGMWHTDDPYSSTVTWTFDNNGLEELVAQDALALPGGPLLTAAMDRQGFRHESDAYPDSELISNRIAGVQSLDYSGGNPQFVVAVAADNRRAFAGDASWITPNQSGYSECGGCSWKQFPGIGGSYDKLYGGNIAVSATDTNNIVFVPTNNGTPYYSRDKGHTWIPINQFAGDGGLHRNIWWGTHRVLTSDKVNGNFYLHSQATGVWRSTDGGASWQNVNASTVPTDNDMHVYGQIKAVPGIADEVWTSVAQGGLWRSTDGGTQWTKINDLQESRAFGFGKAIDSDHPAVYAYAKMADVWGVYRSTDAGASWALLSRFPGDYVSEVNVVNGDMNVAGRVYVGTAGNGFTVGEPDGGATEPPSTSVQVRPNADRTDNDRPGNDPWLQASKWATAYLRFDLKDVSSVGSAALRLYRTDTVSGATVTVRAHAVANDDWSEDMATALPARGAEIASTVKSGDGWVSIPVTDLVRTERNGDGVVTIAVSTDTDGWTDFASRDSATPAQAPQLVISP